MSYRCFQLTLACALWLTLSAPAEAYIDSGTGSFFVQALLSGVLGMMLFAKTFWVGLRSGLQKRGRQGAEISETK